jgi:phospholipid/cholesterol/gamma-HCH transport system substrate-binding protein
MERKTIDIWVGLFVVAGIAAFLVLALKVSSMDAVTSADSYRLVAGFDNIGGLKPMAPVKSAGVLVGRVTEVDFDDKRYEARVTMRIDNRYKFPADTSAAVLTAGLLGEQYIGLEAGGDDKPLKDGDRVKLTQSAVVLESVIGQFLYGKAQEGGAP